MITLIRSFLHWMNWTNLIRQVALLVFVIQFVRWFEHYWAAETADLVYISLGIVFAVELLLFNLRLWLRMLLQFIGVLVAHLFVVDWQPQPLRWDSIQAVLDSLLAVVMPFHPYVWFALSVWLIYVTLSKLLHTREQVFFTMVLSVIVLAIADSYTSIYLWDETAYVVVSGLILMVNRHFDEFRRKHPHTWTYITEYPWGITFTAGVLIAFIGLMSVIAPNVRPLLVDPYTAWHQLQGRSVNFSVKEDTQTAIASLSMNDGTSSSGYGRDDSQLGGGFNYNFDPVFQVTTPVRSYWRGESKSIYTGEGWLGSQELPEISMYQVGDIIEPEIKLEDSVPVQQFTQRVTWIDEESPTKIFGAYPIVTIDSLNGLADNTEDYFGKNMKNGAVQLLSSNTPIQSYTVTSAVPAASERELRDVPAAVIEDSMREYVQLPNTLPDRVYDLVDTITADYETPYEQVKAIETYLRNNYLYTNTPDESKGTSLDFVDRFLFEIGEGYCDFFSTAMAVMVRTMDIPARWVKGYTAGAMDERSSEMMEQYYASSGQTAPNVDLTYVVRNADAHSWVEVYFEGYGWIMFEPTAGFTAPVFNVAEEDPEANTDTVVQPETSTVSTDTDRAFPGYVWALIIAVSVLAAGVLVWMLRRWIVDRIGNLKRWMIRRGLIRSPVTPNEQIISEFNRLLRYVQRKGLVREDHQTVREVVQTWGKQYRSVDEAWKHVLYGFELAKYSKRQFTEEEVLQYQTKLRELKQYFKEIA